MQKRDKCAWKNEMWLLGYIGFSSDILDLHWIYWLFIVKASRILILMGKRLYMGYAAKQTEMQASRV